MATETWIVYKTEKMSDRGWEERMLMPRQSLTNRLRRSCRQEARAHVAKVKKFEGKINKKGFFSDNCCEV